jgi:hypothetical protein
VRDLAWLQRAAVALLSVALRTAGLQQRLPLWVLPLLTRCVLLCALSACLVSVLQQPELDPVTQASQKAELDRGVDKTTSFPVDGAWQAGAHTHSHTHTHTPCVYGGQRVVYLRLKSLPLHATVSSSTRSVHTTGAHYYCDSLDITRPFPSSHAVGDPSWPFVWNKALSAPFRAAGLQGPHSVCPALLQVRGRRRRVLARMCVCVCGGGWVGGQAGHCRAAALACVPVSAAPARAYCACVSGAVQGMAESRELEDFDACRFSYCLISRCGARVSGCGAAHTAEAPAPHTPHSKHSTAPACASCHRDHSPHHHNARARMHARTHAHRKCRLHVGPRYKARGLNDNADPGNEIECDQLVWRHPASADKPIPWSRCVRVCVCVLQCVCVCVAQCVCVCVCVCARVPPCHVRATSSRKHTREDSCHGMETMHAPPPAAQVHVAARQRAAVVERQHPQRRHGRGGDPHPEHQHVPRQQAVRAGRAHARARVCVCLCV